MSGRGRPLARIAGFALAGFVMTACGNAGGKQSQTAASSAGLTAPDCTKGWSCVSQAKARLGFGLLAPQTTGKRFERLATFRSRQGVLLEWRDGSELVDLASYNALQPKSGVVVTARGTQAHFTLGNANAVTTLIWYELGRWQVIFVLDQDQAHVLAIANALQVA